jgi:hypothetical protein
MVHELRSGEIVSAGFLDSAFGLQSFDLHLGILIFSIDLVDIFPAGVLDLLLFLLG